MNNVFKKIEAQKSVWVEIIVMLFLGVTLFISSSHYDILEKIVVFSRQHEDWEIDEIIIVFIFFMFAMAVFWIRRLLQLRQALSEIKQLRGILPICSACKKIRDDQGYWQQIESYVQEHSEALFSHGICPDCMDRLYKDLDDSFEDDDPLLNK